MVTYLNADHSGFEQELEGFLNTPRQEIAALHKQVADIIDNVRTHGVDALIRYTQKFDQLILNPKSLSTEALNLEALADQTSDELKSAIRFAHERITRYHAAQSPSDHNLTEDAGIKLSWKWTPLDAVGLYAPGGLASYPSSVLMNTIPAKLAGVSRIVMCAPAPSGKLNPATAYAAILSGVEEFYPLGGAQAIAAMAFGAGPLRPVDKIFGPGNAYVAEAKRQVYGHVGIDALAGPSEICIIADADNDPEWIAADLLSQAEHDPASQSILLTDSSELADAVSHSVESQLANLSTQTIARKAWESHGGIIVTKNLADTIPIANRIAAEHLQIMCDKPDTIVDQIRHAGAVFIGRWASEALGDYVTGSNHVLPTSGAARFSSGLCLHDFLKRISIQHIDQSGFVSLADPAHKLALAENLPAHANAIAIRNKAIS